MEPLIWDGRQAVRQARRLRRFATALGDANEAREWELVQLAILALAAESDVASNSPEAGPTQAEHVLAATTPPPFAGKSEVLTQHGSPVSDVVRRQAPATA